MKSLEVKSGTSHVFAPVASAGDRVFPNRFFYLGRSGVRWIGPLVSKLYLLFSIISMSKNSI